MSWLHATILRKAFENVLGKPEAGTIAFVRCLTPDVVETLAKDASFAPRGWHSNPRLRLKARKQGVGAREFLRFATL